MSQMPDELKKDIEVLLEKHKMKSAIILIEYQPNEGDSHRVAAVSVDDNVGECDFAHLFEGCVKVSKGFRGICEHVTQHTVVEMAEEAMKNGAIMMEGDNFTSVNPKKKERIVH